MSAFGAGLPTHQPGPPVWATSLGRRPAGTWAGSRAQEILSVPETFG